MPYDRLRHVGQGPALSQATDEHFEVLASAAGRTGPEMLVEASDLTQGAAPNCHVGPGAQAACRERKQRSEPAAVRVGVHLGRELLAPMQPILEKLLASCVQLRRWHHPRGDGDGGVASKGLPQRDRPADLRHRVVIEKDNDIASGGTKSGIARSRQARRGLMD